MAKLYCMICGAELTEPVVLDEAKGLVTFDLCESCNEEQGARHDDYLDELAMYAELRSGGTPLPGAVSGDEGKGGCDADVLAF